MIALLLGTSNTLVGGHDECQYLHSIGMIKLDFYIFRTQIPIFNDICTDYPVFYRLTLSGCFECDWQDISTGTKHKVIRT